MLPLEVSEINEDSALVNGSIFVELNIHIGWPVAVTSVSLRKQDHFDKVLNCLEEILIALSVRLFSLRLIKVKAFKSLFLDGD